MSTAIFTIGHSTRPFDKFLEILKTFHIEMVADVRTIPKSRHNPQFNKDNLKKGLEGHGVGYIHMAELGGLRHTTIDSINTGWKSVQVTNIYFYKRRRFPECRSHAKAAIF